MTKDNQNTNAQGVGQTLSSKHDFAVKHGLQLDVAYYQDLLDEPDLSDADKEQVITALWKIVVAFVEMGFEVHPTQLACGKDAAEAEDGSISQAVALQCDHPEPTTEEMDVPKL